jgi:anti-sigma regulatory factor (Ser/Thr protein kinase)
LRQAVPLEVKAGLEESQDQFEITAQPQNAGLARERVKRCAVRHGFAGLPLDDIEVAVGEAATNAILYGSPSETSRIVVTSWFSPSDGAFHVEVRDQGRGFDPGNIRTDEHADALGGRGLRLMRALMDSVNLHYDGHGMSVRLTKMLPDP